MKQVKHKNRQRNFLHNHPLLRKGGVHEKSTKAIRQQEKQKLKKLWRYLKVKIGLLLNNATGNSLSVSEGNRFTS